MTLIRKLDRFSKDHAKEIMLLSGGILLGMVYTAFCYQYSLNGKVLISEEIMYIPDNFITAIFGDPKKAMLIKDETGSLPDLILKVLEK